MGGGLFCPRHSLVSVPVVCVPGAAPDRHAPKAHCGVSFTAVSKCCPGMSLPLPVEADDINH